MGLLDWLPHSAQQNLGQLERILGGRKTMQSCILVTLLLTFALAQNEPETKELLGSRRKINLLNNVLHSTVRKILRPYRNKIPRTFTKNTRVHHGGVVPSQTPTGSLTLDETLAADDRFTTLVAALAAAFDNRPTADVLNGTAPLTLFAPTTLETLDGGSLTIPRTIDDIFSEGVTVRSSQGTAKIVELHPSQRWRHPCH